MSIKCPRGLALTWTVIGGEEEETYPITGKIENVFASSELWGSVIEMHP